MMLVHQNADQVNRLIRHLAKDFDIYAHIDKRASISIEKAQNVFVYKKYKTCWASFNLTMASLFLLEKAFEKGYDRYLLISGQDVPILSNREIIHFFENNNFEYIAWKKMPVAGLDGPEGGGGLNRLIKYWPNWIHRGSKSYVLKIVFRITSCFFGILSRLKKRPIDYEFYKGSNWINLTHGCAKKIFAYLENDKKYINRFRWTKISDEIFFQTLVKQLDGIEIMNENLRYIDWEKGGYPKTLRQADYEKIIQSGKLFARKIDCNVDADIAELLYKNAGA
jgi:hypothetical protein